MRPGLRSWDVSHAKPLNAADRCKAARLSVPSRHLHCEDVREAMDTLSSLAPVSSVVHECKVFKRACVIQFHY